MTKEKVPIASTVTSVTPTQFAVRPPHVAWLLFVVALALCWWLFLGQLALTTANPVTFNQRQILESERLVIATVSKMGDDGTLELQVTEELLQREKQTKTIRVLYNKLLLTEDESYIFPLSRRLDLGYTITRTELPEKPPLVYPANAKTIERLKVKLEEWRQSSKKKSHTR